MKKKYMNIIINRYIIIIIVILIIFFIICELDRNFSKSEDAYFYYITTFPLPLLGIYNTFIRIINPYHTHIFNANTFKSNTILQNNWKIIQNEALNIYSKKKELLNMKDIGGMRNFDNIDHQKNKWKVFVLKWYNEPLKIAKKLCPNTVNIINKCNDIHCAMFSILEPGKYIPPHKGPSTACLRYHLGLKIPKDKDRCYINVNGKKYNWEEGNSLIFDDTYIHSVINNTNEPRIILFLDIESI